MDDRIRVSDADRENVATRLRDHYAEGRLTSDELDERVAAALGARTFGDLRRVMSDLPGPAPVPPPGQPAQPGPPPWPGWHRHRHFRGPRLLPLALILLVLALVLPPVGWVFVAVLKVFLLFWLVALVAGLIAAARFRRRVRRHWQSGGGSYWRQYQWRG